MSKDIEKSDLPTKLPVTQFLFIFYSGYVAGTIDNKNMREKPCKINALLS